MSVEEFLELFLKELEQNKDLQDYYKLLNSESSFLFRKAYFEQRLRYVARHAGSKEGLIWDAGCGFATTSIFLCLNGYKVTGTTLEFYYDMIQKRLDYWSQYGDLSQLELKYENLFDAEYKSDQYDSIIVQDTLHHLEPIDDAIAIFKKVLKKGGQVVVVEENGKNLIRRMILLKQRGFKRVIETYDEKLQKTYLMGNENIRSLRKWNKLFSKHGLEIDPEKVDYVRFYMPGKFQKMEYQDIISKENSIWRQSKLLRDYFFFGISFIVRKK